MTSLQLPLSPLRRLAFASFLPIAAWTAWPNVAQAGSGHDHGDKTEEAASPGRPRFTAQSPEFELVGVIDGRQLTLYLDHAATNAPVKGAELSLSIGGSPLTATAQGEGEFIATLMDAPRPGVTPVKASVRTGGDSKLLSGEIDIHTDEQIADHAEHAWRLWAVGGVGTTLALGGLITWLRRTRTHSSAGEAA